MVRLLKKPEGGFTYIGLMISVAIIGVTTAVVGMSLKTVSRIEKEKELIWIGHQYRQAIKNYYVYHKTNLEKKMKSGGHAQVDLTAISAQFFPSQIEDLIKDPIAPGTLRHLRKKFVDPMTGKDDWVLVRQNDRIVGVHSNSDRETMKRDNFSLEDEKFEGKTRYSEWEFKYDPNEMAAFTGVPPK